MALSGGSFVVCAAEYALMWLQLVQSIHSNFSLGGPLSRKCWIFFSISDDLPSSSSFDASNRTCEKLCEFGAVCRPSDGGEPACVCPMNCSTEQGRETTFVCGSDGATYASLCQMMLFACRSQINITASRLEPCHDMWQYSHSTAFYMAVCVCLCVCLCLSVVLLCAWISFSCSIHRVWIVYWNFL